MKLKNLRRKSVQRNTEYVLNTGFEWRANGDVYVIVSTPAGKRSVKVLVSNYDTIDDAVFDAETRLIDVLSKEGYVGK